VLTKEDNELLSQAGPGTPMGELFRRFWLPALLSSELSEPDCTPVRVKMLGEDLIAFRDTSNQVGLLGSHCPHRGTSLFFGRNEENGLRCAYHGWKFDRTGQCVDMPNEPPESNFKNKIQHTAYPCQERAGLVWAYLGPKHLNPELPELEWMLVPESHRSISKVLSECSYLQVMEGDYDNSHSSFLHGGLGGPLTASLKERMVAGRGIGRPGSPSPFGAYRLQDTAPRGEVKLTDYGIMMGWRRDADDERYYWRVNHWLMPLFTLIGSGGNVERGILAHVNVPIDDETSWTYQVRYRPDARLTEEQIRSDQKGGAGSQFAEIIPGTFRAKQNKDNDYFIDRALQRTSSFTGIDSIPAQDRMAQESMGAIPDRTREHLGSSDLVIIQVRRRLLDMAKALEDGIEPYAASHGAVYRIRTADLLLNRNRPWAEAVEQLIQVPA